MRTDLVLSFLNELITDTLSRWPSEGESEVQSINRQLGYTGTEKAVVADVPPKFITGNPEDVAESCNGYILIFSLNHRYVSDATGAVAADYAALRQNVKEHLASCLAYFNQQPSRIYSFFTKFEQVFKGFNAKSQKDYDVFTSLRKQTLFVDHLPYFSVKSGDFPETLTQRAAVDNRRFIQMLISEIPPRAILLNGKAASRALDQSPAAPFGGVGRFSSKLSKAESRVGPFRYKIGTLELPNGGSVRVLGCNFVASIYGPNSSAQKYELGTLLAGR